MGIDIHCFAERRGPLGWEPCYEPLAQDETSPPRFLWFYCGEDRNYELFAILAGIRSVMNGGFESISPPRGLPPDLSSAIQALAAPTLIAGQGYHGHSWLGLRELLEFPWHEKKHRCRGLVDAANYQLYRDEGRPRSLRALGESAGSRCSPPPPAEDDEILTNDEMQRYLDGGGLQVEEQFRQLYTPVLLPAPKSPDHTKRLKRYLDAREYAYYTQHGRARKFMSEFHFRQQLAWQAAGLEGGESAVAAITNEEMDERIQKWGSPRAPWTEITVEVPYREYCRSFVDESLPRLRTLGEANDVRIVFWFDS